MNTRNAPTGLGKRVVPRLREFAPVIRGSQEAGFTQPRDHPFAHPCTGTKGLPSREEGRMIGRTYNGGLIWPLFYRSSASGTGNGGEKLLLWTGLNFINFPLLGK